MNKLLLTVLATSALTACHTGPVNCGNTTYAGHCTGEADGGAPSSGVSSPSTSGRTLSGEIVDGSAPALRSRSFTLESSALGATASRNL